MDLHSRLTVDLATTLEEVGVRIADRRPGSLSLFGELSDEQGHQLATDAWTVGLRALANAYAQAQEARLQDIGKALVDDIDRQLKAHVAGQQQTIATVLGRFFDPTDGQVTQRLAAFVDDQGVLARLLEKYLAPQNSVLAQTLAREVGDGFPTFARFGSNVLIVWDEMNAAADPYLHAAILLGLGLATRGRTVGDQGDLEAMRDIEGRIEDELRRLEKMEKHNEGIRKNSDGIADEIRKAQRQLDLLLRKARSTLTALNVELHDESVERVTPIALPSESYTAATTALSALTRAQPNAS